MCGGVGAPGSSRAHGFAWISCGFRVPSAFLSSRAVDPAEAYPGAGLAWQRRVNHGVLTLCSLAPWDRGILCPRPAPRGSGRGGRRRTWQQVAGGSGRSGVSTPGSCARLSATALVTAMRLAPRSYGGVRGASPAQHLPPASPAERDTPTDFRATRRISRHPCATTGLMATYLQRAPTVVSAQPTPKARDRRSRFGRRSARAACAAEHRAGPART